MHALAVGSNLTRVPTRAWSHVGRHVTVLHPIGLSTIWQPRQIVRRIVKLLTDSGLRPGGYLAGRGHSPPHLTARTPMTPTTLGKPDG